VISFSYVGLTKDEPDKRIIPIAAANAIIATKTNILVFTELNHFLDILNVEMVIIILESKIIHALFSSRTAGKTNSW